MSTTQLKFRILFLLISCLLTSAAYSQERGMLKGVVRDGEKKQELTGALIIDINDKSKGTVTDLRGNYELNLPAGKYTFVTTFLGMRPDTFSIEINSGTTLNKDITLAAIATDMNMVVVSASKYEQRYDEITVSMQLIQSHLIESKNVVNVKAVLEQSPGLIILDEEPQMRGGSGFSFGVGSRVATLIDGLPILTGDAGRTDWAFIPTENIEQIEIVEGASSVLYGSSALSGTINFRTKYPKDSTITYIRSYSGFYSTPDNSDAKWWDGNANFSGLNFSHSQKMNQTDLIVGGQLNYDHNYIGPYILDGSLPLKADTINNSDVANKSGRFNFNFRYRPKKAERLSMGINGNAMKAHTNFSLVWGNSSDQIYRAFPGTMTLSDYTGIYVDPFITYYTKKGMKQTLKSRWYFTENENSNDQSNKANVYIAEYELNKVFHRFGGLNLTGGIYYSDTYSQANLYAGSGFPNNKVRNRSVYAQLDKNFFKVVNLQAGVRGEYFKMNREEEVYKPVFRGGMNIKITKGTNIRASYGQGYRFPTITEKFIVTTTGGIYVFPNPDIKPESSWSAEAGIKQGFKIGNFFGYLDFAYFHQEYTNTIEYIYAIWKQDSAGFKFLNTGNSRVKGYEISLIGNGKLTRNVGVNMMLGYTYVLPQTLSPNDVFAVDEGEASGGVSAELAYINTSTDTTDNILKYRFRHLVKGDIEFTYKKIAIGGSCRYYSFMENIDKTFYDLDQPYLLPTGIKKYREENDKGSLVFDARATYKVGKYYSVSVISNNIFNLEYTLRPLKIEAPRTVALQITAKI